MAGKRGRPAQREPVLVLSRLDQVRALADPLRMRILEVFCEGERTTKQVALELGEKPTRLYHHVAALERAGLVRLARTQPKRGTVEKYYTAVAQQFRADPRLLTAGDSPAGAQAVGEVAGSLFERTAADLARCLAAESEGAVSEVGVLSFLEVRASEAELESIRRTLLRLIEKIGRPAGAGGKRAARGERRFRLTIAFFPLDAGKHGV